MLRTITISISAAFALVTSAGAQPLVRVIVDMDARREGIQHTVVIGPQETVVRDVGIYIFAVKEEPTFLGLGFVGGVDRGLSFGHAPSNALVGHVAAMAPHAGTTLYPGARIELLRGDQCCVQPWFDGPEVQYLELGGAEPVAIRSWPVPPVFTVDIELDSPSVGDTYRFYLLDAVAANWGGGHGMFTSDTSYYINTGGDCTPDSTPSVRGPDADHPVPIPPATFLVDIVDGPPDVGGGATIRVVCTADFDADGAVTSADFFDYLTAFFGSGPAADFNGDAVVNSQDFFDFLGAFFAGCA